MGGKLNAFTLGDKGVNLTASPIHVEDGAWVHAQNAVVRTHAGEHAIAKRPGLTALTTSAMAGAVVAIVNIPFPSPSGGGYLLGGATSGADLDELLTSSLFEGAA